MTKWLNDHPASDFPDICKVEDNGPVEWFFEIDVEIPVELHDSVKDFVFYALTHRYKGNL
jgi:hypothetical protein